MMLSKIYIEMSIKWKKCWGVVLIIKRNLYSMFECLVEEDSIVNREEIIMPENNEKIMISDLHVMYGLSFILKSDLVNW